MTVRFEQIIAAIPGQLNTVIHVGAGFCKELEYYTGRGVENIYLVEPNDDLISRARRKTSMLAHVRLINLAVAPEAGEEVLNITNNLRFSSLLEPQKLFDFFPNVEVIDRRPVEATTLESLCSEIEFDNQTNNLLVMEVQGLEYEILQSTSDETLDHFNWILVRSSRDNLYRTPAPTGQNYVSSCLTTPDYSRLTFEEETPPFISHLYQLNRAQRELSKEKSKGAELRNSLGRLESLLEAQRADQKNKTHSMEQSKREIIKLRQNSEKLKVDHDNLRIIHERVNTDYDNLSAQSDQQQVEMKIKTAELDEVNRSLRLSNKLCSKLNADLTDLQERFKTSIENQQQQHLLLCELKDRLGQATEFYQQLSLEDQQFDGDVLEPRISKFVNPEE